jgi:HSP20 family molecular chaperone IbpA
MFVLIAHAQNGIGFIFLAVASGFLIYWIREIRMISNSSDDKMTTLKSMQGQQNDWIYDVIKNKDNEIIFVAEVPGPEDQIKIRLTNCTLHIKVGQNFVRDVPLEGTKEEEMNISDYKYRNGVLTIKIQKK